LSDTLWTPVKDTELEQVHIPKPPGKKGSLPYKEWAMEHFLVLLRHGYNLTQASERLGYTYRWWLQIKDVEPEWAQEAQRLLGQGFQTWEYPDLSKMSFYEFCERYGGFNLAEHQLDIAAALEDRLAKIVLVLGHPESGKSTLISLWYPLYRLAQDPDTRIALVTKNSTKAQDLLTRVKRYLTEEHLYADTPGNLITDFNGFKPSHASDLEWSQNQFFVRHRKSGERDPTVQALGLGKQIYGSRLDYLILDDALVQDNQTSEITRNRIDNWFDSEARSRAQKGQTIVNGTRLLPMDLYGQWAKAWKSHRLFRYVKIPAILEEYTENERVNWPEYWTLDGYDLTQDIDGEEITVGYQMGMREIRESITAKDPNRWKLVYQQEEVEENSAVFRQEHMDAALELGADRKLEQVYPHERLILGIDPATTGRAAAVLIAVDPVTKIRTVVDLFVGDGLGATGVRQKLMYQFWEKYREHTVDVTVIETNFAKTLLGDETLLQRAQDAGTQIVDHHTTGRGTKRNKWDQEYGIAAMASLFGAGLIRLPNAGADDLRRLAPLMDDLLVFPWSDIQDAAIALWVAEGEAANAQIVQVDQYEFMQRRGVPPNIRGRMRKHG
jgi:hypothetical protein